MKNYRIKIQTSADGAKSYWPQIKDGKWRGGWNGLKVSLKSYARNRKNFEILDVSNWGSSGGMGFDCREHAIKVIQFYIEKIEKIAKIPPDEFIKINYSDIQSYNVKECKELDTQYKKAAKELYNKFGPEGYEKIIEYVRKEFSNDMERIGK